MKFQAQVQKNIEMCNRYDVSKIVTACPFCLQMLEEGVERESREIDSSNGDL